MLLLYNRVVSVIINEMENTAFINQVFRSLILLTFAWTQSFSAYYALEGKRCLYSFLIFEVFHNFST